MKISDKDRTATKPDGTKIPVVDSKFTTLLQPTEEDIKKGVRGDPAQCMYAVCCRRLYGSEIVYFTRQRAYIELRGKKGRYELHRFILANPAMVGIKDFDASRDVSPEAILLLAPKGRQRLDVQHAIYKERKENQRQKKKDYEKAYVSGEAPVEKDERQRKDRAYNVDSLRRPATGKFQFQHHKLR
jgi:hypothetical protein